MFGSLLTLLNPSGLAFKAVMVALVVAAILGGVYYIHHDGYKQGVAAQKQLYEDQLVKDQAKAALETKALQDKLDKAQNELIQTKNQLDAIKRGNDDLLGRLRANVSSFNGGINNDTKQALIDRTVALSTVFNECSSQLTEVARSADTLAAEVKELQDAWPK